MALCRTVKKAVRLGNTLPDPIYQLYRVAVRDQYRFISKNSPIQRRLQTVFAHAICHADPLIFHGSNLKITPSQTASIPSLAKSTHRVGIDVPALPSVFGRDRALNLPIPVKDRRLMCTDKIPKHSRSDGGRAAITPGANAIEATSNARETDRPASNSLSLPPLFLPAKLPPTSTLIAEVVVSRRKIHDIFI